VGARPGPRAARLLAQEGPREGRERRPAGGPPAPRPALTIALALLVGLLQGSLHCTAMCGPFALSFGLSVAGAETRWRALTSPRVAGPLLAQTLGRLTGFVALGAVFGALGSFVDAAARVTGLEAAAAVAGGLAMLLWAVDQARTGHGGAALERWSLWRLGGLGRLLRRLLGRRDPWGAYAFGLLLGLHPCGLLYAMLLAAAASGSAGHGAALLAAFGLGTVPALSAVAAAGALGRGRIRGAWAQYLTAGVVATSGVLFALRGLALNGWVPHVSPWLF
jgi:sulfite exporter TauE/SafE